MTDTLELPNGETVAPEDVFLFEGYPYRFVPGEGDRVEFSLSPLYWGGGDMDVPFTDPEQLESQWGPESRGTLTGAEWEDWLIEARADDRFDDDELAFVEREVLGDDGFLTALGRRLGLG